MSQETNEYSFEVESPSHLRVSNIRGSVDVKPGDEGVITVVAVKHLDSGDADETEIVVKQLDDGQVVVETRYQKSGLGWLGVNRPCKVDYVIRTPVACSVKMGCVSSEASIQGLEGEFVFTTVSGSMALKELSGPVKFSNVSGKVAAEEIVGPLKMDTVSGQVRVAKSQLPSVNGSTVSGHVTLQTPLTEGPYKFNSVSGHLTLVTPEDTGCNVQISSLSGSAKVGLPVTSRTGGRSRQRIEVGGGGPEVQIKSVSGYLRLVDSEDQVKVRQVSREKVEPSPPKESQMDILDKIDRGELSVEEALQKLNA